MIVTVILCTYNRCDQLEHALASVAASNMPPAVEWEVLVVDNNSNDHTREVSEAFCRRFPGRFRYVFEPRPGKSYALNTAVREARGTVVAFMDDDVAVESTWLQNLCAIFDDPRYAGAGGRIILTWPARIPRWLSTEGRYSRHPFPGFDHGDTAKDLSGPAFGTNMAFRKSLFEKYGGFRTDLGPSPDPGIPPHSEDTEFGRRILNAGERMWYEPAAVVYHPVADNRLNQPYFLSWWFDRGRAVIRESGSRGISLERLGRLVAWVMRWLLAMQPEVRFYSKLVVWQTAGEILESYRQSKKMPAVRALTDVPVK